jgi:hypothetical protein
MNRLLRRPREDVVVVNTFDTPEGHREVNARMLRAHKEGVVVVEDGRKVEDRGEKVVGGGSHVFCMRP